MLSKSGCPELGAWHSPVLSGHLNHNIRIPPVQECNYNTAVHIYISKEDTITLTCLRCHIITVTESWVRVSVNTLSGTACSTSEQSSLDASISPGCTLFPLADDNHYVYMDSYLHQWKSSISAASINEKTVSLHQTSSFISTPLRICSRRHAQLSMYSRHFISTVRTDSLLSMRSESEYGVEHEHQVRFYNLGPSSQPGA